MRMTSGKLNQSKRGRILIGSQQWRENMIHARHADAACSAFAWFPRSNYNGFSLIYSCLPPHRLRMKTLRLLGVLPANLP
jgi:hypothetical protein